MARPGGVIRVKVSAPEPETFQVWFGSVPAGMHESQASEELVRNCIPRPTKLICRQAHGKQFAVGYFASQLAATAALHGSVVWSDGSSAVIRPSHILHAVQTHW